MKETKSKHRKKSKRHKSEDSRNIENQQSPLKSPQTSPPERRPLANTVKEVHQGLKKRRFWSQMFHQQGSLRTKSGVILTVFSSKIDRKMEMKIVSLSPMS